MKVIGIYGILNTRTGRLYIGSSLDIDARVREHFRKLRLGIHRNNYLQASWNKHGTESFSLCVIEELSRSKDLLAREQFWISETTDLYNIAKDVFRPTQTPEIGRRISRAQRGRKLTKETIRKIVLANTGKKRSAEFSLHLSRRLKGRPLTEEHKAALRIGSINKGKGRRLPESQRIRIGDANAKIIYDGLVSPKGVVYRNIRNLTKFCREHGLTHAHTWQVVNGRRPSHLGWRSL